jgi:DNA topoisomerase-1|tara:strand:+ start:2061 stop:4154 length:2094 start_codon:yes stop_codon:yes gene_type:complete
MSLSQDSSPYTLVICEKPDSAERIAEALSEKELNITKHGNIKIFTLKRSGRTYVICSASGHLYTISDTLPKHYVYPTFDVEWFPIHTMDRKRRYLSQRIGVIKKLAENADVFINACDFDQEGDTICFNILKYACGEKQNMALRAKFSTLTKTEVQEAFRSTVHGLGNGLAEAGRTRHIVDFIFGVNLSRALSESYHKFNQGYRVITVGRVQGPALSYVVKREVEIRTFVPTPFWRLHAELYKDDTTIIADYENQRVFKASEIQKIKKRCEGKKSIVTQVTKSIYRQFPPFPFNTGSLQKDAYRIFGYLPSHTLRIAERLYLSALISYPRTSSQKLPSSIDFQKIFTDLQKSKTYNKDASNILRGKMTPNQGPKVDPAHPAIYPTGDIPKRTLSSTESNLYDLIVRRFLAVFGEVALREQISVTIDISGYLFNIYGKQTLKEGWIKFYRNYTSVDDKVIPHLIKDEKLPLQSIVIEEKFTKPLSRYNQSTLLEKMEKEDIGTKATRADIIKTLYDRGYFYGTHIFATDIALTVNEVMSQYSPKIISVDMTRKIEKNLEKIENNQMDGGIVIHQAVDQMIDSLAAIKKAEKEIGGKLGQAVITTIHKQNRISSCPLCNKGTLNIIRSKKTHKRFIGCSRYIKGCRASAPLPQRGTVTITGKTCSNCGWPIIYLRFYRKSWRQCVNSTCKSKRKVTKDEM